MASKSTVTGPSEAKAMPATAALAGTAIEASPAPTPVAVRATYLELTYQGQQARFGKSEINRARLYGQRKLVAVDDEGRECESALITCDGRYVLQSGCTADLYVNESGDVIARRDLMTTEIATKLASAEAPSEIEGLVADSELLEYAVTRVHALYPVVVPAQLADALRSGSVFRLPCQRRSAPAETSSFLVGTETGAYLVQAEPHGFDYVDPEQHVSIVDESDDDDDDLDAFAFPDSFGGVHEPT
jgi:hypothetical protein